MKLRKRLKTREGNHIQITLICILLNLTDLSSKVSNHLHQQCSSRGIPNFSFLLSFHPSFLPSSLSSSTLCPSFEMRLKIFFLKIKQAINVYFFSIGILDKSIRNWNYHKKPCSFKSLFSKQNNYGFSGG